MTTSFKESFKFSSFKKNERRRSCYADKERKRLRKKDGEREMVKVGLRR